MALSIVATNAQRIIQSKGLKQKNIARKMNLTENQLSSIFNGRKRIDSDIVISLCGALDVSPNVLFGYE